MQILVQKKFVYFTTNEHEHAVYHKSAELPTPAFL